MTEKQKMLSWELYNPAAAELVRERTHCKSVCAEFNRLPYGTNSGCERILRQLFGKAGRNFNIEPAFWCDYGYNIELGENFYSNHNLVILDCAKVTFGDNVLVAPNCGSYTVAHPLGAEARGAGLEYAKPIAVGNNVWFGGGVTVLPGVTIGDNTVIGAGSVVARDIPGGVVAIGNPCRPTRDV
jgi:acetyltransferase-like isoleucine patch superfamily enzyme